MRMAICVNIRNIETLFSSLNVDSGSSRLCKLLLVTSSVHSYAQTMMLAWPAGRRLATWNGECPEAFEADVGPVGPEERPSWASLRTWAFRVCRSPWAVLMVAASALIRLAVLRQAWRRGGLGPGRRRRTGEREENGSSRKTSVSWTTEQAIAGT